jgi:hypothetical protein
MKIVEPEAVQNRKQRRLKRRRYYAAGVMEFWTIDQHDKWKVFGLYLHVSFDPFPRRIIWLRVWWSSKNPKLITSYYIATARKENGTPFSFVLLPPVHINHGVGVEARSYLVHDAPPMDIRLRNHAAIWDPQHQ